jgi:hypothetical protein
MTNPDALGIRAGRISRSCAFIAHPAKAELDFVISVTDI